MSDTSTYMSTTVPCSDAFRNSFFHRSMLNWNSLPVCIRQSERISTFKAKLIKYLWAADTGWPDQLISLMSLRNLFLLVTLLSDQFPICLSFSFFFISCDGIVMNKILIIIYDMFDFLLMFVIQIWQTAPTLMWLLLCVGSAELIIM